MSKTIRLDLIEIGATSAEAHSAAKKFYSEIFGFEFTDWGPDYSDCSEIKPAFGINSDPGHRPSAPLPVFYSEDLEGSKETVEESGGEIVVDIFEFPGGHRFHFKDPAGNVVAIWSDK
ncbi:MAG: VOC family protein [Pyrinomonadaceae bacterium]